MAEVISQDSINQAFWNACDTFRGTVDTDTCRDLILSLLFLKYISDLWQERHDEYQKEYGGEPELIQELMNNERFKLPPDASFSALWEKRHEPGNGERIDQALHAIEEANSNKLRVAGTSVFRDISFNTDKLGDEKQKNTALRHLLESFADDKIDLRPSRLGGINKIGNGFEYLIKKFATVGSQKTGEFFTPSELSELIAELLDPQPGERICDPTCGSGFSLVKCGRKVRDNHQSKHYELYGQEIIGSTWSLAKINMFIHGEDNHRLEWGDTIRNPKLLDKNGSLILFDIIIADPPFNIDKWGHDEAENDKYGRFSRGIPPKTKGDYAFILHMIDTMKPETGRIGVVVPLGVLFRGAGEGKIRTQLIQENLLDTVIGLPEKLFYGTGIPAAILIFKKTRTHNNVLFIDASKEYKAGKHQNVLTRENIDKIVAVYRKHNDPALSLPLPGKADFIPPPAKNDAANGYPLVDKYAYVASVKEIQENDYNLNIPHYVDTFEEGEEIGLMAIHKEREKLNEQLVNIETGMAKYLEDLGYGV